MIGLPTDPAVVTVLAIRQFRQVANDVGGEMTAAFNRFAVSFNLFTANLRDALQQTIKENQQ